MPSIFEYKLRRTVTKELEKKAIFVDESVFEALISSSLVIMDKMQAEQGALRLRQYQYGLETERAMIKSIIDAKENIGEPEYLIYREIKKYLSHFKKPIKDDDDE